MCFNHFMHAPEAACCAFLFDEEHRVMLVGGVIHRDDQVPHLSGHPFMSAAILMDHHEWVPGKMWDLIVTMDDATSEHYSMFFCDEEGTASSFRGVHGVIEARGR